MAKANIQTKSGTTIVIDGTPEEISDIIGVVQKKEDGHGSRGTTHRRCTTSQANKGTSLTDLLLEIREEGYFDKPQGLVEIKKILEEKGHIYPVTTLSGALLNQARKRFLRRIREGKRWVYVKGSI